GASAAGRCTEGSAEEAGGSGAEGDVAGAVWLCRVGDFRFHLGPRTDRLHQNYFPENCPEVLVPPARWRGGAPVVTSAGGGPPPPRSEIPPVSEKSPRWGRARWPRLRSPQLGRLRPEDRTSKATSAMVGTKQLSEVPK
ncbi:hypothetical protein H1C71_007907, partial [Ictidomys tridecemlineatus]